MTKQEWDQLQKEYNSSVFALTCLKVGSFKITLQKNIGEKKIYHICYVNGEFKGLWLNDGYTGPEKEFMYKSFRTFRLHSDKELKRIKRSMGAKYAKKWEPVKIPIITPYYPSFAAFKKQMIKTELPISIILE